MKDILVMIVMLVLLILLLDVLELAIITPVQRKSVMIKPDVSSLLFVAVIKRLVLPTPVIRLCQLIAMMAMSVLSDCVTDSSDPDDSYETSEVHCDDYETCDDSSGCNILRLSVMIMIPARMIDAMAVLDVC
jgi:hypothetical protein